MGYQRLGPPPPPEMNKWLKNYLLFLLNEIQRISVVKLLWNCVKLLWNCCEIVVINKQTRKCSIWSAVFVELKKCSHVAAILVAQEQCVKKVYITHLSFLNPVYGSAWFRKMIRISHHLSWADSARLHSRKNKSQVVLGSNASSLFYLIKDTDSRLSTVKA